MRIGAGAMACLTALVLAACGGAPTSLVTGETAGPDLAGPAISVTAAYAAEYGPPPAIAPLEGIPLEMIRATSVAPVDADTLWVAGTSDLQLDGGGSTVGVWRGRPGGVGTWYSFGSVEGLAVTRDGTAWVVSGTSLVRFDGSSWRRLLGSSGTALSGLHQPVAGPDGSLWLPMATSTLVQVTGDRVLLLDVTPWSLDSSAMTVTADGAVWSGGDPWPWAGSGLRRFDGITWAVEEPWDAPKVTGMLVRADPAGPVWAWLLSGYDPWGGRATPRHVALARHTDADGWDVWVDPPGVGGVSSMAAADGAVWLVATGDYAPCPDPGRLLRFDGTTWSRVATDVDVAAVHAVNEGRLWVTTCDGAVLALTVRR